MVANNVWDTEMPTSITQMRYIQKDDETPEYLQAIINIIIKPVVCLVTEQSYLFHPIKHR